MKRSLWVRSATLIFVLSTILVACNGNKNSKENDNQKKDTVDKQGDTNTNSSQKVTNTKPPILNIMDTVSLRKMVLVIKDSAASEERISIKLAEIYGNKLQNIVKNNALKVTGAPVAWYRSQKAPFFFEAGLPVDKKPAKLPASVKVKEIGIDSVIVVHFYGPYHLTSHAYDAVNERLKSEKRSLADDPYEIYVTDPIDKDGKPIDPYKVQTDIVFPIKKNVKKEL